MPVLRGKVIVANCREGPALSGEITGVCSHLRMDDLKIKQPVLLISVAARCVQAETKQKGTVKDKCGSSCRKTWAIYQLLSSMSTVDKSGS